MTCSPANESSDPVGSSAKTTSGFATNPRASATRCASPPDRAPERRSLHPSEVEAVEPRPGAVHGHPPADAIEQQRQRNVLHCGQLGDELAELEHEPEPGSSQRAPLGVTHRVEALPGEVHRSGVGHEDAGEAVQERGLPRATRPHHGEQFPRSIVTLAPRNAGVAPKDSETSSARSNGSASTAAASGWVTVTPAPPPRGR